jgi:hypothetical protein
MPSGVYYDNGYGYGYLSELDGKGIGVLLGLVRSVLYITIQCEEMY